MKTQLSLKYVGVILLALCPLQPAMAKYALVAEVICGADARIAQDASGHVFSLSVQQRAIVGPALSAGGIEVLPGYQAMTGGVRIELPVPMPVERPALATNVPAPDTLGEPQEEVVRILSDQVVATVNGIAITLKDLVPVSPGQKEVSMSPEDYAYRLNASIERILVRQAADAGDIRLSAEQQQNVGMNRQQHLEEIEARRQEGLMWTSVTDAQIDFEADRAEAILLRQNVLAQAGAPPVQPSQEDVEAQYQANPARYGALPDDVITPEIYMTIRRELDPQYLENYLAWETLYMEGLKSKAQITVSNVPPTP